MRHALVLVALLVSGCTLGAPPDGDALPATTPQRVETLVDCPAASMPEDGAVPAPKWRRGLWWNHTQVDDEGVTRGFVLSEVLGCREVAGNVSYQVRETAVEFGQPLGHAEQARVRIAHFDVRTMNEVWDECRGLATGLDGCVGRYRQWDFPLVEGKAWTDRCCGDVVSTVHFRAVETEDGTWRIEQRARPQDAPMRTWMYAPALGLFVAVEGRWVDGPGALRLVAHGEGALPPSTMPPSARPERNEGCVGENARGAARSAPLLPAWQASVEGLAVRLAFALDDRLVGAPRVEGERMTWETERGAIEASLAPASSGPSLRWRPDAPPDVPARDAVTWLDERLRRFAFDDAAARFRVEHVGGDGGWVVRASQLVGDRVLAEPAAVADSRDGFSLEWRGGYALGESVTVSDEDARLVAAGYARCALDAAAQVGDAPGELVVRDGSLALRVRATAPAAADGPPRHCGLSALVLVDAQTAAVLGHETPPCF